MFEKAPNTGRTLTQDDWKRTQIRIPQDIYANVIAHAEQNNLSINQAMLDLMGKGVALPNEAVSENLKTEPPALVIDEKNYYEQTDAQFKIRLPHELKDKIRASADEHNRTMTADIVARLEQSFERQQALNGDVLAVVATIQEQHQTIQEKQALLDKEIQQIKEHQAGEFIAKMEQSFQQYPQDSILQQILTEIQSLKQNH